MRKPTRLLTQEQSINTYFCTVEEGTNLDEVLQPTWWAHVTKQLLPYHEIKVMPADGAWWAHLMVRSVGATEAHVHLLNHVDFDYGAEIAETPSPFVAKYRGPSHMHCVVRKDNNAVEKTGFQTAEQARQWISEHAKTMSH